MKRLELNVSDAHELGFKVAVASFPYGSLAITWDTEDPLASGSGFDFERRTAVSKSIGECLERRFLRQHFAEDLQKLRTKLLDGSLGSAFAFDLTVARSRALREAQCRAIRHDLWHGHLQSSVSPGTRFLENATDLTGITDTQLVSVKDHPQWLGVISWSARSQGVLYSDAFHEDPSMRYRSARVEHLMLHLSAQLPQLHVPAAKAEVQDLAKWLTSGKCVRAISGGGELQAVTHQVAMGFVSVVDSGRNSSCRHHEGECSPFGVFPG